ncbi:hypothetical protein SASPL_149169 [Salvia splendens]|uniref:Uncharacterized protein n=1 Tax=Salvia splendens TaxID=180675 RepID=A0A8X8WB87_SALSN|nr:hypothetical protein SASPL_149169 [Salvia splendens]
MEWIFLILITTCLILSLTISSLKEKRTCGLELWRWCLMILVTFSGRLVSGWIIRVAVFLVERNFMLREKVLYFVYGLIDPELRALVAILAATVWLVKIILVKVLASSFHVATYFDRMKESMFQHYVLDTLLGPPMDEAAVARERSVGRVLSRGRGTRKIDMEKLRKLSMQNTATAWSVKRLVNYVRFFGLSTISKTVDQFGGTESEITSEWEAMASAKRIFKNVAKPRAK